RLAQKSPAETQRHGGKANAEKDQKERIHEGIRNKPKRLYRFICVYSRLIFSFFSVFVYPPCLCASSEAGGLFYGVQSMSGVTRSTNPAIRRAACSMSS